MSALPATFQEARFGSTPIRNLNLAIEGTDLEDVLKEFERERERLELKMRSHYYLSTEWGVPFGTVSIAIPFYLAQRELRELHAEKVGDVEGASQADILRYLRHELGHVVNYAYKLYEREDWLTQFGSITQPYRDDYRPEPFSPRFVRHLPGWYAQKHPDEDWAETFAVWMTPGLDWKTEYQAWPMALGKLNYCDRIMGVLKGKEPIVAITELDEDVAELSYSVEDFYRQQAPSIRVAPGLRKPSHAGVHPRPAYGKRELRPSSSRRSNEADLLVNPPFARCVGGYGFGFFLAFTPAAEGLEPLADLRSASRLRQ